MYSVGQQKDFSLIANTTCSTERGFRMTSEAHVLQLLMKSRAGQENRFTFLRYFLLSHYIVIKDHFSSFPQQQAGFLQASPTGNTLQSIILVFPHLQTPRFSYAFQSEKSMVFRECLAPHQFSLVITGDLYKLLLRQSSSSLVW